MAQLAAASGAQVLPCAARVSRGVQLRSWDRMIVPLPFGRGGTGRAVFYQGELYVFGGETLNGAGAVAGNVYNRVDVYDPALTTLLVPGMVTQ